MLQTLHVADIVTLVLAIESGINMVDWSVKAVCEPQGPVYIYTALCVLSAHCLSASSELCTGIQAHAAKASLPPEQPLYLTFTWLTINTSQFMRPQVSGIPIMPKQSGNVKYMQAFTGHS